MDSNQINEICGIDMNLSIKRQQLRWVETAFQIENEVNEVNGRIPYADRHKMFLLRKKTWTHLDKTKYLIIYENYHKINIEEKEITNQLLKTKRGTSRSNLKKDIFADQYKRAYNKALLDLQNGQVYPHPILF